ncbi:MAG: DUF1820 family protein [Gammaproteobacteria bacterium]|nr:DUF1820 family protein [Gammaproteobacteria bacterium]NNF61454.1 DUF1820 family protein [Gammaproteobacteria bacterium]NNM21180.1 DUF1820 family protein [Gammaproteobacteria bacterium]
MPEKKLYRITFHNHGKIYEVYARDVSDAGLLGFVCIEGMVFGERGGVVVDPSEERLRDEFDGVERTWVPMHAIVRIDQVDRQGVSKISDSDGSKITPFPVSFPPRHGGSGDQ